MRSPKICKLIVKTHSHAVDVAERPHAAIPHLKMSLARRSIRSAFTHSHPHNMAWRSILMMVPLLYTDDGSAPEGDGWSPGGSLVGSPGGSPVGSPRGFYLDETSGGDFRYLNCESRMQPGMRTTPRAPRTRWMRMGMWTKGGDDEDEDGGCGRGCGPRASLNNTR